MLFQPIYLREPKMEAGPSSAPKKRSNRQQASLSESSLSTPVQQLQTKSEVDEDSPRIPLLVSNLSGLNIVIPKEATRDVMSGKVSYYLVNEKGMTLFEPKHMMIALKLNNTERRRIQDFPCIGAHYRELPYRPRKIKYRRRFISPELIGKGIYVSISFFRRL